MSPVYDYCCDQGHYQEVICHVSEMQPFTKCTVCGKPAKRTFTPSGHYTGNQDAGWARASLGIFDKDDKDPVVRRAFDTPTKGNVMAALRHKGYDIHEGSRPGRRATSDDYINESHPRFMRHWMEKNRIEVRTR